jgi:hypothetical protein
MGGDGAPAKSSRARVYKLITSSVNSGPWHRHDDKLDRKLNAETCGGILEAFYFRLEDLLFSG